jgi:plastocyanin
VRKGPVIVLAALAAGVAAGALPALAADQSVTASGFTFSPSQVTVDAGDTVTWNNAGGTHNVVFDDGPAYTEPSLPSSDPWTRSRTFDDTGTFHYHCGFHGPSMSGSVVVVTPGSTPSPTPTPTPTATPTPTPTPTATATATPTGTATAKPTPAPETSGGALPVPTIAAVRVTPAVRGGRLRGSVRVEPAGATLAVVVRAAGRVAGRLERRVDRAGVTAFSVKLAPATRRRLAQRGRLRATVRITVRAGGRATTKTVKPLLRSAR